MKIFLLSFSPFSLICYLIEKTYFWNANYFSCWGSTLDKSSVRMKKDLIVKVKKPALRSPVSLSAIEIHAGGRAFSTH